MKFLVLLLALLPQMAIGKEAFSLMYTKKEMEASTPTLVLPLQPSSTLPDHGADPFCEMQDKHVLAWHVQAWMKMESQPSVVWINGKDYRVREGGDLMHVVSVEAARVVLRFDVRSYAEYYATWQKVQTKDRRITFDAEKSEVICSVSIGETCDLAMMSIVSGKSEVVDAKHLKKC